MKHNKDYSIYFVLCNLSCFVVIFGISLVILFKFVKDVLMRVICVILLGYLCGQFETRIMVRFVNRMVTFFLPKDIRREEIALIIKIRNREKNHAKSKNKKNI